MLRLGRGQRIDNGFCDLALLVGFGVVSFGTAQGNDALQRRMFELAMGAFLTIQGEARLPKVGDEFADFAWHGVRMEEPEKRSGDRNVPAPEVRNGGCG